MTNIFIDGSYKNTVDGLIEEQKDLAVKFIIESVIGPSETYLFDAPLKLIEAGNFTTVFVSFEMAGTIEIKDNDLLINVIK